LKRRGLVPFIITFVETPLKRDEELGETNAVRNGSKNA
jgi:hypothetical protein